MPRQLFDLTGKIALISGASRGIGEEIAKLLGEQGAHAIVSSRKIDDCSAVAEAICNKAYFRLYIVARLPVSTESANKDSKAGFVRTTNPPPTANPT